MLRFLERRAAGEPLAGLVFLHGRGGLESDGLDHVELLDPRSRLYAFLPRGPLPWGQGRAAWDNPAAPAREREQAMEAIGDWFDGLPFPIERLVLAGWSQGAALAYALGLARDRPRAAAVLAFGGFLPDGAWFRPGSVWPLDFSRPLPPVAIVHGTNDDAVPVDEGRRARGALTAAGADVFYRETTAGHWIDPDAMAEVGRFLERAIESRSPSP